MYIILLYNKFNFIFLTLFLTKKFDNTTYYQVMLASLTDDDNCDDYKQIIKNEDDNNNNKTLLQVQFWNDVINYE